MSGARPAGRWALLCVALASAACGDTTEPVPCDGTVATLELEAQGSTILQRIQDGLLVDVTARQACGQAAFPAPREVSWSTSDPSVAEARGVTGSTTIQGFVEAVGFGTATVTASVGAATGALEVEVVRPDPEGQGFTVLGSGPTSTYTTDLWAYGDYVYNGSQPWSCGGSCEGVEGWLYTWRIGAGGGLERTDSLALPAAKINDVKVSSDGSFAVAGLERGGADNGIVLLDLSDPAHPTLLSHYTRELVNGVHNVWIEKMDGRDYVFVVEDGGATGGLHVLDVTDPTNPNRVAGYWAEESFVHDVYVRDGLAFVSHWNAGLVILDVGNGGWGGSPDAPVEVGRVVTEDGRVHNAWYWPEGEVVFVGEERFPPPDAPDGAGVMHVVDVSDMENPTEVATFGVTGATPHNFWLDEENAVLYAGWYTNGLRAVDVSGTLSGDLAAQGRELGYVIPSGPGGGASVWAPQLHRGLILISDIYNGLWSLRFDG